MFWVGYLPMHCMYTHTTCVHIHASIYTCEHLPHTSTPAQPTGEHTLTMYNHINATYIDIPHICTVCTWPPQNIMNKQTCVHMCSHTCTLHKYARHEHPFALEKHTIPHHNGLRDYTHMLCSLKQNLVDSLQALPWGMGFSQGSLRSHCGSLI